MLVLSAAFDIGPWYHSGLPCGTEGWRHCSVMALVLPTGKVPEDGVGRLHYSTLVSHKVPFRSISFQHLHETTGGDHP